MMIRVKYIATEDGRELAYFPDTQRFFFVDDEMKELISDMEKLDKNHVLEKYGIDPDTYDSYLAKMILVEKDSGLPLENSPDPEELSFEQRILPRLVIHLANDCNLRCVYCYANGGTYNSAHGMISREVLDRTLDVFYKEYYKIEMIQLFGGEPLMNREMLEYTCKRIRDIDDKRGTKTDIGLVTNGTLIDAEFIDLLKKYNISVTVSLDGAPAINDRLRIFPNGSGTGDVILKKMHMLEDAVGTHFGIEATYSRYHEEAGITVMDLFDYLNGEFPGTGIHIVPAGGSPDCDFVLRDQGAFVQAVHQVGERAAQDPDREIECHATAMAAFKSLEEKDKKPQEFFCGAGTATIDVTTTGDIYPCFMLADVKDVWLGNVCDPDVLHSRQYAETIKRYLNFCYKMNNAECVDCFANTICSACVGQFYLNTGELFKLSPADCDRYRGQLTEAIKGLAKIQEAKEAKR